MHTGPLFAAIDLGSNSFHFLLARARPGAVDVVYRSREKVRLANGLTATGELDEEAIERGLSCLYDFSDYLHGIPPEHITAVATAAMRKATNREVVLERFSQALGAKIEVISGEREAELIYQGATWNQQHQDAVMVIDIGGASTEVVVGVGQTAKLLHSFDMGCVVYQRHFFTDDRITRNACDTAIHAAQQALKPHQQAFRQHSWLRVMGASGTFKALAELSNAQRPAAAINLAYLEQVLDRCIAAGSVRQLNFRGLREDRRAVFMGGLCILLALYRELGIAEVEIASGALREGLLRGLAERIS